MEEQRHAKPVGVFRNTGGKSGGKTMYEVLGVAYVRSYDETTGYFELEYSPAIISDNDIDSAKSNLEEDLRLWRDTQQVIREGQAKFRNDLIEVYAGKCAITGYDIELALDAAHVRKYNGKHTNIVQNGLLLRKDLHIWHSTRRPKRSPERSCQELQVRRTCQCEVKVAIQSARRTRSGLTRRASKDLETKLIFNIQYPSVQTTESSFSANWVRLEVGLADKTYITVPIGTRPATQSKRTG